MPQCSSRIATYSCIHVSIHCAVHHGTEDELGPAASAALIGKRIGSFDLGPSRPVLGLQRMVADILIAQLGLGAGLLVALVLERPLTPQRQPAVSTQHRRPQQQRPLQQPTRRHDCATPPTRDYRRRPCSTAGVGGYRTCRGTDRGSIFRNRCRVHEVPAQNLDLLSW